MIEQDNIFLAATSQLQLSDEQEHDIHDIYLNAQAIQFYLISTLRKCIREMVANCQQRRAALKCYFNWFQEGVSRQKQQKIVDLFKVAALRKIAKYRQNKVQPRQKWKLIQKMMRQHRKRSILKEWKNVVAIEQTSKQLQRTKTKECFIEFLSFLTENKQAHQYKALLINNQLENLKGIYTNKLLARAFYSLIIYRKMALLSRQLMRSYFQQFRKHARTIAAEENKKIISFRRKCLLSKCFSGWKTSFHEVLAQQYHYKTLIARYFDQWRSNLDIIASERQIQKNNQCIADIYLQRQASKTMKIVLQGWRQSVIELKENRQTNLIITTYAEKKRKQVLLSRYFQMLKQNCINNKINIKYYGIKLKRKAIDSFKMFFRQSVYREEKIIEFMEKRLLKQYFKKLVAYNQKQHQKISKFRKAKYFKAFTQNIIAHYCLQNQLSLHFYRTNLLYKVLFALKKEKTLRQKEEYTIGLVNVILPLRRWQRVFRIRKFQKDRVWFQKKDIFREWRLMLIRRNSEDMAVRQFRETSIKKNGTAASLSKMEEQFQFSNILSTIAKIRNNLQAERQETIHQRSRQRIGLDRWEQVGDTPGESIDYSLSLDYP